MAVCACVHHTASVCVTSIVCEGPRHMRMCVCVKSFGASAIYTSTRNSFEKLYTSIYGAADEF